MVNIETGDWILFERTKAVKRTINWSESGPTSSDYYFQRARWAKQIGGFKDEQNECNLFIAAEFYEKEYIDMWPGQNLSEFPHDTCLFRVDERFHYGQGMNEANRYIVYHPQNRVDIHQGRFRSNNAAVALLAAGNLMPDVKVGEITIQLDEKFFNTLVDTGVTLVGDKLRVFEKPQPPRNQGEYFKKFGRNKPLWYVEPATFRKLIDEPEKTKPGN
ncbi:hypothetical protein PEBR_27430 [Penicillium brasilianum]|uniref:Uncharacterized protein n=1 Tax=Penicillium brasilianum TaxID=104259 RepID=A0A1S9RVB0_PENBI|nr:hypothetical protein PEBR_27430 [Penicillium brasilianum]